MYTPYEIQYDLCYTLLVLNGALKRQIHDSQTDKSMKEKYFIYFIIGLGFNVALIHQNMSYRDNETKEKVETHNMKQRGGKDRNSDN